MLTGRDEPVQRFLEEKGEIQPFLQNVFALTDRAVEKYLKRGFTDLSVGFGCTGGQHRSVYSAEHLARHIKENFLRWSYRSATANRIFMRSYEGVGSCSGFGYPA